MSWHPVQYRLRLGRVPLLHALEATVLGRREALALDGGDVDDHRALRGQSLAQSLAQGSHVVTVDHAHVGPVELLPPQARSPERLDRLLQLRSEPFERGAYAARQTGQASLNLLPGVPQFRVEPHAVEVAGQRTNVGGDRHAVVVEHNHDRGAQPTGLADRLEGDPAGHRAIADHRHDLAVLPAFAHPLLDPHRVTNRRGGVTGAHDVVL